MKAFVAYRSNSLFDKFVPQILEGLDVVSVFAVPAGTPFEEFYEAGVSAAEEAKSKGATLFLHDQTCEDLNFPPKVEGQEWWNGRRFSNEHTLDHFFSSQLERILPGTVSANFIWFAKQITGDKPVNQVVIVKARISDHGFAGSDDKPYGEDRSAWALRLMTDSFTGASVSVVETLDQAVDVAGSNPEALIVADRHCGLKRMMKGDGGWYHNYNNWPHPCKLYILPFETTCDHLVTLGHLDFSFDVDFIRQEILKSR